LTLKKLVAASSFIGLAQAPHQHGGKLLEIFRMLSHVRAKSVARNGKWRARPLLHCLVVPTRTRQVVLIAAPDAWRSQARFCAI
jgi:hypothetical protein